PSVTAMDYRRFLGQSVETVAPVVGLYAWLADRCVRIATTPGWWRIRVRGRAAEPVQPATAQESAQALAPLGRLRGPLIRVDGVWTLVHGAAASSPVDLMPTDEEPALFAPLCARRWPIGELLLWDQLEWESETDEAARRALEDGQGLADIRGA